MFIHMANDEWDGSPPSLCPHCGQWHYPDQECPPDQPDGPSHVPGEEPEDPEQEWDPGPEPLDGEEAFDFYLYYWWPSPN